MDTVYPLRIRSGFFCGCGCHMHAQNLHNNVFAHGTVTLELPHMKWRGDYSYIII